MNIKKTKNKCSHCGKDFKYESERKRHEQSHFPQFKCKVCDKSFSFNSALRRHEKQHERTGSVKCNECGHEFKDHVLLSRHIKYAHGGTYSCTKCKTSFNSELALQTHTKTHKTASERKYHCSYNGCNKTFNFSHHLKHHELTHTKEKPYHCWFCGKGFIQSHNYKIHLKTHSDDPSLHCTYPGCNKKFASINSKKRHQAMHDIPALQNTSKIQPKQQVFKDVIPIEDSLNIHSIITPTTIVNNEVTKEIDDPKTVLDKRENCKIVLGSCIMDNDCVCAQIPDSIDDNCDFEPIERKPIKIEKFNINLNSCETCDCCTNCDNKKSEDFMPIIEYTSDGNVKLKDSFDIDFPVESVNNNGNKDTFIMNSCKDVLGNCIVSGNGTIGEGCLCAKMAMEEQVTSQEIEDITPHPN